MDPDFRMTVSLSLPVYSLFKTGTYMYVLVLYKTFKNEHACIWIQINQLSIYFHFHLLYIRTHLIKVMILKQINSLQHNVILIYYFFQSVLYLVNFVMVHLKRVPCTDQKIKHICLHTMTNMVALILMMFTNLK